VQGKWPSERFLIAVRPASETLSIGKTSLDQKFSLELKGITFPV
jgi:hypothetical protein